MRQCVLVNGFGVKMGENIMLNINTTEKPMPRIGKLNADRYHMQEVYRRKNPVYLRIKRGMDVLLLEANHDINMLQKGHEAFQDL